MSIEQQRPYIDIHQAHAELIRLGFEISIHQLYFYAANKRLPFFKFGRKLYIDPNELIVHFKKLQLAAIRKLAG